jgi:hypothetical protein
VHGIQKHTILLECAIEEARSQKWSLTICLLDLANAFGSIPHAFLDQLFSSLPIPVALRNILSYIHQNNQFQFVVGQQLEWVSRLLVCVREMGEGED